MCIDDADLGVWEAGLFVVEGAGWVQDKCVVSWDRAGA